MQGKMFYPLCCLSSPAEMIIIKTEVEHQVYVRYYDKQLEIIREDQKSIFNPNSIAYSDGFM